MDFLIHSRLVWYQWVTRSMTRSYLTQKKNIAKLFGGLKDVILVGVLFAIFSLPFVNGCIGGLLKFAKDNTFYTIAVKTVLFMLVFFILQNYLLAKKA